MCGSNRSWPVCFEASLLTRKLAVWVMLATSVKCKIWNYICSLWVEIWIQFWYAKKPFLNLHINILWCQTECLTILTVLQKKPIVLREQKLLSLHFLISTCTKRLHLNESCFIQYILQKKTNKWGNSRYLSVIKLQTPQLPWKQKEKVWDHQSCIIPLFKKRENEKGQSSFQKITLHPVSLKLCLHSHNTMSSGHINYYTGR